MHLRGKWGRFAMLTVVWGSAIVLFSSVDLSYGWPAKAETPARWTRAVGFAVGYLGVWESTSDPGGWHAKMRVPEFNPSPTLMGRTSNVHAVLVTPWLAFGLMWFFHIAWIYARRRPALRRRDRLKLADAQQTR